MLVAGNPRNEDMRVELKENVDELVFQENVPHVFVVLLELLEELDQLFQNLFSSQLFDIQELIKIIQMRQWTFLYHPNINDFHWKHNLIDTSLDPDGK